MIAQELRLWETSEALTQSQQHTAQEDRFLMTLMNDWMDEGMDVKWLDWVIVTPIPKISV